MLYSTPPKKLIIVSILNILNKYTDADHTLSQKDIQRILKEEYSIEVDRKAVRRNLSRLMEFDDNIEYSTKKRKQINKKTGKYEEIIVMTDFYIRHSFETYELKMLIDSIIFSNHIPKVYRDDLIKRLEDLSTVYFKSNIKNIEVLNSITAQNKQWFIIIEDIDKAINNNQKIHFTYNRYDVDKKLHSEFEITVSPYKIVAANNHYYLVCQEGLFDNFNHYRIDRITDLEILKEKFTPIKSVDLKEYLASHPYMSSGKAKNIRMVINEEVIDNIIDYFGDGFRIVNKRLQEHGKLEIELKSNVDDMYYWALQFGDNIEILEPQELRDRIRDTIEKMRRKYYHTNSDRLRRSILVAEKRGYLDLSRVDLSKNDIDVKSLHIKEIMLCDNNISDYSFVGEIEGLNSIRIRGAVPDFSFLRNVKELKLLMLKNTGFKDLSIIKDLPIKDLYLSEENIENIDILYQMKDLKWLRIKRNTAELIDIEHLKSVNPMLKIGLIREGKELRLWEEI